jgi:hypothetical protein
MIVEKTGSSTRVVDGVSVAVETYQETNANILELTIGTNAPCGGDGGHGARTLFELKDAGSTAMAVDTDEHARATIVLSGDAEAHTFLAALKQAVEVIERQIAVNASADGWDYVGFGTPEAIARYKVYQFEHMDDLSFMQTAEDALKGDRAAHRKIAAAKAVLSAGGWEGDGELQIFWLPPFLHPSIQDCHGVYVWHVKQFNNGTSWIASPVTLPFAPLADYN